MALLGTILAGFVLISVASAGTKVWGILKPSSESENNFYQFAERITTLLEDENDYAYTRMTYSIDSNHGLLGFDYEWDDTKATMLMKPCTDENGCRHAIVKPPKCAKDACLCLIKEKTSIIEDAVPFTKDKDPICRYFHENVKFIGLERIRERDHPLETYEGGYMINGVERDISYGYIDKIFEQVIRKRPRGSSVFDYSNFVGNDYRYLVITGNAHNVDESDLDTVKVKDSNGKITKLWEHNVIWGGKWKSHSLYIEKYKVGDETRILIGNNELMSVKERKNVIKAAFSFEKFVKTYIECHEKKSGDALYTIFSAPLPFEFEKTCHCEDIKLELPKDYKIRVSNDKETIELWHTDFDTFFLQERIGRGYDFAILNVTEGIMHYAFFNEKVFDENDSKVSIYKSTRKTLLKEPGEENPGVKECANTELDEGKRDYIVDNFERYYNTDYESILDPSLNPCLASRFDFTEIPDAQNLDYPITVNNNKIWVMTDKSIDGGAAKRNRLCYLEKVNNKYEVREVDEVTIDKDSKTSAEIVQANTGKDIYRLNTFPTFYLTKKGNTDRICFDPVGEAYSRWNPNDLRSGNPALTSLMGVERCPLQSGAVNDSFDELWSSMVGCANNEADKCKTVELDFPEGFSISITKEAKTYIRLLKNGVILAESSNLDGKVISKQLCFEEKSEDGTDTIAMKVDVFENLGDSTVKISKGSDNRLCLSLVK